MTELDGEVCLVLEYVAVPSLADLLDRQGPPPAARVAAIGTQNLSSSVSVLRLTRPNCVWELTSGVRRGTRRPNG